MAGAPITFPVHRRPSSSNFTPSERRQLLAHRRRVLSAGDSAPVAKEVFVDVDLYGKFMSLGYYYTYLHVGDPEQFFTVIMDTGSVVTAIPCQGCKDCGKHSGGSAVPHGHGTETGVFVVKDSKTAVNTKVKFSQSYTEGSSLSGYYVEDTLCLGQDCDIASEGIRFKFGCATRMTNLFRTQLADGIMGMANHGSTVLNAMRSKFHKDIYTLCLSPSNGYFTIGGYETVRHYSPVVWNTNYQASKNKYYHLQVTGVHVDGSETGVKQDELKYGSGGALVDSGTTYTYVPSKAHAKICSQFNTYCDASSEHCKGKKVTYDKTSVGCYNALTPEQKATFPHIQFVTDGGTLCIPPTQYFFEERGKSCVGLLRDSSSFVLGGNFLMNFDVIFDREQGRVGFARASCQAEGVAPPCCGAECSAQAGQVPDATEEVARHLYNTSDSSGGGGGGQSAAANAATDAANKAVAALVMDY